MKYFALISLGIFFIGCSVQTLPPMKQYHLELQSSSIAGNSSCDQATLKLLSPVNAKEYMTTQMHYKVDNIEEGVYNNSSWSVPLVQNIYNELVEAIRKSGTFKTVISSSSLAQSDYIAEIEIDAFEQKFDQERQNAIVEVDIVVNVIKKSTFQTVAQKRFSTQVPSTTPDAKGGVIALNKAFNQVAQEIVAWLAGVCDA